MLFELTRPILPVALKGYVKSPVFIAWHLLHVPSFFILARNCFFFSAEGIQNEIPDWRPSDWSKIGRVVCILSEIRPSNQALYQSQIFFFGGGSAP